MENKRLLGLDFVYVGLVFITSYVLALIISKIAHVLWIKSKPICDNLFVKANKWLRW